MEVTWAIGESHTHGNTGVALSSASFNISLEEKNSYIQNNVTHNTSFMKHVFIEFFQCAKCYQNAVTL